MWRTAVYLVETSKQNCLMILAFRCHTVFMNSYIQSGKPRRTHVVESALGLQAVHLLDRDRERIWYRHYNYQAEPHYGFWIHAFVGVPCVRHPYGMGCFGASAFRPG